MKRLVFPITTLLFALTILFPVAIGAKEPPALPETPGTYSVPGNAKLKLRVFVYNAKNGSKPAPSAPTLVCGLSDPDSYTLDGTTGWKLPAGNWTYQLNAGSVPSRITSNEFPVLATNALNTWDATDAGTNRAFLLGSSTSDNKASLNGQNIISWGRTGSSLATSYTWYYTDTRVVVENDIIFNKRYNWEWANQSANPAGQNNCAYENYYDAQNILTHELGHLVGLDDNYDDSYANNTLYGYGSTTEVKKNTLEAGDFNAVNSIY